MNYCVDNLAKMEAIGIAVYNVRDAFPLDILCLLHEDVGGGECSLIGCAFFLLFLFLHINKKKALAMERT